MAASLGITQNYISYRVTIEPNLSMTTITRSELGAGTHNVCYTCLFFFGQRQTATEKRKLSRRKSPRRWLGGQATQSIGREPLSTSVAAQWAARFKERGTKKRTSKLHNQALNIINNSHDALQTPFIFTSLLHVLRQKAFCSSIHPSSSLYAYSLFVGNNMYLWKI